METLVVLFIGGENRKNRISQRKPASRTTTTRTDGKGTRARTEGQAAMRQNITERNGTDRADQPGLAPGRGTETEEKTAYGGKFTEKTARRDQTGPRPGPGPGRKDKRHRNIPTERNGAL